MTTLTAERLREVLHYDPVTGVFTRLTSWSGPKSNIGDVVGTICRGYVLIMIDGRRYQGHRLAWLYMVGAWPTGQIDHINMRRADNAWKNLRRATGSQNQANRKARKDNKAGIKGVSLHKRTGRWTAQIQVDGKKKYLGLFATLPEAADAYEHAAISYHGEFARTE